LLYDYKVGQLLDLPL